VMQLSLLDPRSAPSALRFVGSESLHHNRRRHDFRLGAVFISWEGLRKLIYRDGSADLFPAILPSEGRKIYGRDAGRSSSSAAASL
jgi:hypothetical protein